MQYFFAFFLVGLIISILQIHFTGIIKERDAIEDELHKEVASLRLANKHLSSEVERLERLSHG